MRAIHETRVIAGGTSLQDEVAAAMAPWRFNVWVSSSFAGFALGLCRLGLFGVVAFGALQRAREMGIRAAVGATPAGIWRLLIRGSLSMVGVGVVVGTTAGVTGARLLSGRLYGVPARDAGTFVIAALLLFATGLVTCHVPA